MNLVGDINTSYSGAAFTGKNWFYLIGVTPVTNVVGSVKEKIQSSGEIKSAKNANEKIYQTNRKQLENGAFIKPGNMRGLLRHTKLMN